MGGRKQGFSLLEILVALMILGVAFAFILDVFPTSLQSLTDAQNYYLATQVARAQVEYARQKGYNWLVSPPPASDLSGNVMASEVRNGVPTDVTFDWQMTTAVVQPPAGPSGGGVAQVDVMVHWSHAGFGESVEETTWVQK